MAIDLIAAVVAVYGFYLGYTKGIIKTIFGIISIFLGLLAALKLSPYLVRVLEKVSGSNSPLIFLLGFAFKYRENSVWWDKLLTGKTARIITTLDQPSWSYRLFFRRPSVNQLKRSTLEFSGVKPVKVTYVGPIRQSKPEFREQQLRKIALLGKGEGQ